ncbi:hypothetical protein [Acidicapsa acidisoli]|uniref:hypothetical protein n=1 Tax=Acidicapsa acidisoli TaxID=1615681 RepID=UPI0021E0D9D0|nr:hypothetical protein [Acidicapsa acidisoli]
MPSLSRTKYQIAALRMCRAIVLPLALFASLAAAQPRPATQPHLAAATPTPVASDKDVAATQEELIRLLRQSPTLTAVVAHDPSLLADQDYVRRNNPQLAQFLENHPEVPLNPDFYLFTHLDVQGGQRYEALEREVWPDLADARSGPPVSERIISDGAPVLVFICVMGVLVWLTRLFVENRRWGRIFKLQTEVHGKLIDRFSANQELLNYMGTDAGKRFLEAAPIPVDFEPQQRVPNAVARVLTPLQIGIVLVLLGCGFLVLRHAEADMRIPMLVLGTLFLMPGIGFILSAGVTWILAGRLGLIPESPAAGGKGSQPYETRFDASDRQ